jgi:tetratricopeptide (TPR) repeat protein
VLGGAGTFAYFRQKQEEERAEADPIVAAIRLDPERYLDRPLPPAWLTLGMADRLCEAATGELVRSVSRSLLIAQLATVIADALPDSYPRVMRAQRAAHAWKTLSNAHRFGSRYDAALSALDVGDRRLEDEAVLAYDRGILKLARGITLCEMGRPEAALVALGEAHEVFAEYEDAKQIAQCDLSIGMALHGLGRIVEARQTYLRVIASARGSGDLHTAAAAYNNIGRAATDAGDISGSIDALQQARAIFRELDMPTESARATWSIGVTELTAGHFDSAIRILSDVRGEFLRLGMPEEAGLAGIDLIEALLATNGRPAARELTTVIVEEFRAAGLNERALQAVTYLRETADIATSATAHHVGAYLRKLKSEPSLLFIEPDARR